jgi:hypothetical protein
MDALIIFGEDNAHPLRFLLHKKHRHVWCAVRLDQYWVSYNWHQGIPLINVDQTADFDLAGFYRQSGYEVIETTVGEKPSHGPWMANNCTGHTMVVCGIRAHHIYTPHQLWRYLRGRTMFSNIKSFFRRCAYLPGFGGGGGPAYPSAYTSTVAAGGTAARQKTETPSQLAERRRRARLQNQDGPPGGLLTDRADTGKASSGHLTGDASGGDLWV